jgi:hypothetical protein
MNKEFLKMQKLAGLITEGQYKKTLNENEDLSDKFAVPYNTKALGLLYRKVTPGDNYNDGRKYTWIPENVIAFIKYLGYDSEYGGDPYDVATEIMDFCAPGSPEEAYALGVDPKTFNPEETTMGMYTSSIYDQYPQ